MLKRIRLAIVYCSHLFWQESRPAMHKMRRCIAYCWKWFVRANLYASATKKYQQRFHLQRRGIITASGCESECSVAITAVVWFNDDGDEVGRQQNITLLVQLWCTNNSIV